MDQTGFQSDTGINPKENGVNAAPASAEISVELDVESGLSRYGCVVQQHAIHSKEAYLRDAIDHSADRSFFAHEGQIDQRLSDPEIRARIQQSRPVVIMPVTRRELEHTVVLQNLAEQHRKLFELSGGQLTFVLVFNDHKSERAETVAEWAERFRLFVRDHYAPMFSGESGAEQRVFCLNMNSIDYHRKLNSVTPSCPGLDRGIAGKGNAIALAAGFARKNLGSEIFVLHDSDIKSHKVPIISSMLLPLLEQDIDIAKLSFVRFENGKLFGRLTRGFSSPLIQALAEHHASRFRAGDEVAEDHAALLRNLARFRFPFSGEVAFSARFLDGLFIHPTYGLEAGMINHAAQLSRGGEINASDVMVSRYSHFHSPSSGLVRMLEQTFEGLIIPLLNRKIISINDFGDIDEPGSVLYLADQLRKRTVLEYMIAASSIFDRECARHGIDRGALAKVVKDALQIDPVTWEESSHIDEETKIQDLRRAVTTFGNYSESDGESPPKARVAGYAYRLYCQLRYELHDNKYLREAQRLFDHLKEGEVDGYLGSGTWVEFRQELDTLPVDAALIDLDKCIEPNVCSELRLSVH